MIIKALTVQAYTRIVNHGDAWELIDQKESYTGSGFSETSYLLCSLKDDSRFWRNHDEFEVVSVIK